MYLLNRCAICLKRISSGQPSRMIEFRSVSCEFIPPLHTYAYYANINFEYKNSGHHKRYLKNTEHRASLEYWEVFNSVAFGCTIEYCIEVLDIDIEVLNILILHLKISKRPLFMHIKILYFI